MTIWRHERTHDRISRLASPHSTTWAVVATPDDDVQGVSHGNPCGCESLSRQVRSDEWGRLPVLGGAPARYRYLRTDAKGSTVCLPTERSLQLIDHEQCHVVPENGRRPWPIDCGTPPHGHRQRGAVSQSVHPLSVR